MLSILCEGKKNKAVRDLTGTYKLGYYKGLSIINIK